MNDHEVGVTLEFEDGYKFAVDFEQDAVPKLLADEPPPLGRGEGPNASRILAAAVGNCLGASLLFCLRKAHVDVESLKIHVTASVVRNEKGRFRVPDIGAKLDLRVPPEQRARTTRCLEIFEDFCLVTQSVRKGVDVSVDVDVAEEAHSPTGAGPRSRS